MTWVRTTVTTHTLGRGAIMKKLTFAASTTALAVSLYACTQVDPTFGDDNDADGSAGPGGNAATTDGATNGPGGSASDGGAGPGPGPGGSGGSGGAPPKMHGDACTDDEQCVSDACLGGSCCGNGGIAEDNDADGFTAADGDCNDCEAATNPGAIDVVNTDANKVPLPNAQQVDEDCSGAAVLPSDPASCDDDPAILLDSNNAQHAVMALELCQTQQGDSWGVIGSTYQQIDGSALPNTTAAHIGHGILPNFGPNVSAQQGNKLLALSTGPARRPSDPGYEPLGSADKNYQAAYPSGVPFPSTTCPGALTGTPYDTIALQVQLRAPTNATGARFRVKFYTYEFPSFICSSYNDIFLATMLPAPMGASPPNTNNVTFDTNGEPLSVNNALLDVCSPQTAGGKIFACPSGTAQLTGTGFETHGATSWLTTTVPVTGGDNITLRFGIMDAQDGVQTSTVLIDAFEWVATQGTVVVSTQ